MSERHRLWLAGTFAWLFLLFNVERIFPAIDLASFVYALSTLLAVALLAWKPLRQVSRPLLTSATLLVFLIAKCALGYRVSWETLPLTLLEAGAITVTVFLSTRLMRQIDEFHQSTEQLAAVTRGRRLPAIHDVETSIQREMRRARRHERPISLVAMQVEENSLRQHLDEFRKGLEDDLVAAYAAGQIGQLLLTETKANDILAYENRRFLLLLPETNEQQALAMIARLTTRCREKYGVELLAQRSQFPVDEITLNGLLERVVQNGDEESQPQANPAVAPMGT